MLGLYWGYIGIMEKEMETTNPGFRGLNNYEHHVEVHLRYRLLWLYREHGTIILVTTLAPILFRVQGLGWDHRNDGV